MTVMDKTNLEVCVDSVVSAIAAKDGGADRVELCSNLIIGGTTPGYELFKKVREVTDLPIHVLIRPRFGDFLYDDYEKSIMKQEIKAFSEMGADAVVIGLLSRDGNLDTEGMREVLEYKCDRTKVTLHRAFDMCKDPFSTVETAIELGVDTILTSGQKNSCMDGKGLMAELIKRYCNEPIELMAGSGLKYPSQIKELYEIGVRSFHMSGKVEIESAMEYRNPNVSMGLDVASEYINWVTDAEAVRLVREEISRCVHAC